MLPVVVIAGGSPCGIVYVLAMIVVVVSGGRHGATHDSLEGSESEWPGECHGSRSVLSERRWSTQMGVRGHGFRGVGTVRYLCRKCVFNISIAASSVMGMGSY